MSSLFGFDIYSKSKESLIDLLESTNEKVHVISGNAETLKYPLRNKELSEKFKSNNNIIIADGISVSAPLKFKQKRVTRIPGIEIMQSILERYDETGGKTIYLLGAKEDVLNKLVSKIGSDFKNIEVVGYHHGYIDIENCGNIIENIKKLNPDTIFVAMGTPIQESFIFKYMDELPCRVFMGVGGSFDVLSGCTKRAPMFFRKVGLEWAYRIISDPKKIKRVFNNLFFTIRGIIKG